MPQISKNIVQFIDHYQQPKLRSPISRSQYSILNYSMESKKETQAFFREFINEYKANPQLWDPRHEQYKNKYRRNLGNEELLKVIRKYDPYATRHSVRQKVNSLRSNYRKELLRHLKSKRILPNGEEEFEYIPNSWKFYALQFLNAAFVEDDDYSTFEVVLDDNALNESKSDLNLEDDVSADEHELINIEPALEDTYNSNDGENEINDTHDIKVQSHIYKKRKISKQHKDARLLNQIAINREIEAIGTNVAYKLMRMDQSQRYFAELLINKVLIHGLKKNLSDDTDLTDLQVLDMKTFKD